LGQVYPLLVARLISWVPVQGQSHCAKPVRALQVATMSRDVSHLGEPPNIIRRTSSPLLVPGSKREEHSQIEEIRLVAVAAACNKAYVLR